MRQIINMDRSIIPACDVGPKRFEDIVKETCDIPKVGAYKVSATLALEIGLRRVFDIARKFTKKPLIYDHQKAGTDIPETSEAFVRTVKEGGMDALIIFPLAGPATQTAWIQAAQKIALPIISGGHMSHGRYLLSEGGYIADQAIEKMFVNSANCGIRDYVVPGNKRDVIERIRKLLISHKIDPVFYAPGFIIQGGQINTASQVAGPHLHAIVGRALYDAPDIQKAAQDLISNL